MRKYFSMSRIFYRIIFLFFHLFAAIIKQFIGVFLAFFCTFQTKSNTRKTSKDSWKWSIIIIIFFSFNLIISLYLFRRRRKFWEITCIRYFFLKHFLKGYFNSIEIMNIFPFESKVVKSNFLLFSSKSTINN